MSTVTSTSANVVLPTVANALPSAAVIVETPCEATPIVASQREAGLDAMRFVASAGVVWAHAATVSPPGLGRFAVPMYLMAAVTLTTFSLKRRDDLSALAYLAQRWGRLYPAFLFWCAIYEAHTQLKRVLAGGIGNVRLNPLDFVGGTFEHLWYLPFLLIATVAIVPILRLAIRVPRARLGIAAVAIAAGLGMSWMPVPHAIASIPHASTWYWLQHAWWAMPALSFAIAMSCVALARDVGLSVPRAFGAMGVGFFVACAVANWHVVGRPVPLVTAMGGVGAFWFATSGLIPRAIASRLAPLGASLGMGVYLSHVLFLRAWLMIAERAGIAPTVTTDLVSFAVALAGAVALSILLKRGRWTRWTIGL